MPLKIVSGRADEQYVHEVLSTFIYIYSEQNGQNLLDIQ